MVSDSAGRIWFSLRGGLPVVDPSRINDNSDPALPHIEEIAADDNITNVAAVVQIPPSPRRITFEYTGMSLAVPERIRVRYFLQHFDGSGVSRLQREKSFTRTVGPALTHSD